MGLHCNCNVIPMWEMTEKSKSPVQFSITLSYQAVEMLEDLVLAAVNQALNRAQEAAAEQMQKATGGMMGNLPGGMKMPFSGM